MNPKIIFENDDLLAIDKPPGLVVHSDGKTIEPNVCDWLIKRYGERMREVGEPTRLSTDVMIHRPGIVHRLDRGTSGVMIVAKTQEAYVFLKKQFQEREVKKTYNAFVWGSFDEIEGLIDRPIGKSKSDFRKWSAERFARGELRPAVTEYKVLGRVLEAGSTDRKNPSDKGAKRGSHKIPMNFSYIEAFPKTGRTHQIRVHFKAINHPVLGDTLYAPNHPLALGFERIALHARNIEIQDLSGKKLSIEAPLPKDFKAALELLA